MSTRTWNKSISQDGLKMYLPNDVRYWEDTLSQLYKNYRRESKKLAKIKANLKHINVTIQLTEKKIHEIKKQLKGANTRTVGL